MEKEDIIKVLNKELDKKAKERKVSVLTVQEYKKSDDIAIAKVSIFNEKKKV
jgi:hypothetical protein